MRTAHYLHLVWHLLLFFLLGIALIVVNARDLFIAMTEPTATVVHVDQWQSEYHGQRWLTVTGFVNPVLNVHKETYDFVPLIPIQFKGNDSVHLVIRTRPGRMGAYSGSLTVTGVVEDYSSGHLQWLMPSSHLASDVICVSENTAPADKGKSIGLVSVGVILAVISAIAIRGTYRRSQR